MSSEQAGQIIVTTLIWNTTGVSEPCRTCASLDGLDWEQDLNESILHDPSFGNIWDLDADMSLVHPNCRCNLIVDVKVNFDQWTDLSAFAQALEVARSKSS